MLIKYTTRVQMQASAAAVGVGAGGGAAAALAAGSYSELRWDKMGLSVLGNITDANNEFLLDGGNRLWVQHLVKLNGTFRHRLTLEGNNPNLDEAPNTTLTTMTMGTGPRRDPLEIEFAQKVTAVGTTFRSGRTGAFTASIEALDGAGNSLGRVTLASGGNAPCFLGIGCGAGAIAKIKLDLVDRESRGFRVNQLAIIL